MYRRITFVLALAAIFAAGCSDDEPGGGADRPRPPETPEEPPSWETTRLELRMATRGFGENFSLATADLDGDGEEEVVYGGRGLVVLDPADGKVLWSFKWAIEGVSPDNVWATGIRVVSATGDETPDLLVSNSDDQILLIDGADGSVVWQRTVETNLFTTGFALVDADDDSVPDLFPWYGNTVHSGATGEPLWSADFPNWVNWAYEAELDGDDRGDLILVAQKAGMIGTPTGGEDEPQLFGIASDGTVLFENLIEGTAWEPAVAQLDGEGTNEVVVVTAEGLVLAFDATGTELWRTAYSDGVAEFHRAVAVDLDGDGGDEILAIGIAWDEERHIVVQLASDGTIERILRFTSEIRAWALEGDLLILGGGTDEQSIAHGFVEAFDRTEGTGSVWRADTPRQVRHMVAAVVGGKRQLILGLEDANVIALDPATGEEAWSWETGNYVYQVAAGDLDGDGVDEIVRGDHYGFVTAWNLAGERLWTWRPDVGITGAIHGLAVVDVDGDGKAEVAAAGQRYYGPEGYGVIALADGSGKQLWSVRLEGSPNGLRVADLDGDGTPELITGENANETCGVAAFRADGNLAWRRPMFPCSIPAVAVGDVDGDGTPEIGYGEVVMFTPPHVALLSADGTVRWHHTINEETTWLHLEEGALYHGGYASGARGHVTKRNVEDGSPIFLRHIDPVIESEDPLISRDGWSRYGTAVPDRNDDGIVELAVSTDGAYLHLVDGATGASLWTVDLDPVADERGMRRQSGPVLYVPETETTPAWLAVAHSAGVRSPGTSFALDLDGNVVGEVPMLADAMAISLVHDGDRLGAAVGAGLGLYLLEAVPVEGP